MGFVLSYSGKVRQALQKPANVGVDALVIAGVAGLIVGLASILGHAAGPRPESVQINLSIAALPKYAFFSLSRALIAYFISLVFTLIYGTIAAHNRFAEKFMVPILDVLQSLPVLSFLPGLVLLFVRMFPHSWMGLELACVISIFTAQAWNMTFSYYTTVRGIPEALREAAAMQGLSGWQIFRYLELPASMIGLVWNSMISFAGGWFVITVNEAFMGYELPGLGSYMVEAQNAHNISAMIAGVVAMVLLIVLLDQLLWRPVVVWSEKFKVEESTATEAPRSWFLQFLRHSHLLAWAQRAWKQHRHDPRGSRTSAFIRHLGANGLAFRRWCLTGLKWLAVVACILLAVGGVLKLGRLLMAVPFHESASAKGWNTVLWALLISFLRVGAAVIIGTIWTLPVGILIGLSPKWSNRLQPVVQVVASFPAPLIYLLMVALMVKMHLAFTFGCVVLMLLGTQWYTLFNVIAGAMAIPTDLREAGEVYHLTRWRRWMSIYIPAVFPFLVTGLITAAGGAWNATIVAEEMINLDGSHSYYAFGIGSLIDDATNAQNFSLLAAAVVAMGLTVVIINRIFWKRVYRVAEDRYSLNM